MEAASRMGDRRAVFPTDLAAAPGAVLALRRVWSSRRPAVLVAFSIAAATIWSFWPTLVHLFREWFRDPQYSHGPLVPAFAAGLLWMRRDRFPRRSVAAPVPGLALLAVGAACRVFSGFMYMDWLEAASLLPCLLGLVLTFGGWPVLRWSRPRSCF